MCVYTSRPADLKITCLEGMMGECGEGRRQGWLLTAAVALAASTSACGGTEPTAPAMQASTSDDAAATVLEYLDVDMNAPLNYAAPLYPAHYDANVLAADNTPSDNPVTDAGATLGRVLFHDVALSLNRTKSCASCHIQSLGFTDAARFSEGFEGGHTTAHAMRLANARFYAGRRMFWDRRAVDVEDQVLQPPRSAVEMGFSPEHGGVAALIARLDSTTYYPLLFRWAFGSPQITETRMRAALAQYVRSLVSTGSRFDTGFAQLAPQQTGGPPPQGPIPGFTTQENLGYRIFIRPPDRGGAGCSSCHQLPTMALNPDSRSNGLDAGEDTVFKSPSLKNVAVTGPYMHDGRFATLEQVVDHYSTGIQDGPALDRRLRGPDGRPIRPNFTDTQKAALVAFMKTLTDTALLVDPRFSDPFRH